MALDSGNFLSRFARSIRSLSIDMVENAKSGHPGAPLGLADVMSYLFKEFLSYSPQDPQWFARDRFVLSAGHASAMLYSTLFMTGYKFTLDDLKKFLIAQVGICILLQSHSFIRNIIVVLEKVNDLFAPLWTLGKLLIAQDMRMNFLNIGFEDEALRPFGGGLL